MTISIGSCAAAAIALWAVLLSAATPAADRPAALPNADFARGDDAPDGWTLSGGRGRWVDRQILEVTGDGEGSNFWRCDYRFTPGALYRFAVRGRGTPSDGCGVVGPVFANRDVRAPSPDWKWLGHVFRVPEGVTDSYLRLGQWQTNAPIQFDAVKLTAVLPAHLAVGEMLLGEGESIRDGRYTFSGTYAHESSNYHRPLDSATAGFNSDRWTFGGDSQVTYRFALPGHKFTSGHIGFNVNYHVRGGCLAEVSRDQKTWHTVAAQEKVGAARAGVPDDLLPAETLFVRLRALPGQSAFQVNRIEFTGGLAGAAPGVNGQTVFADLEHDGGRDVRIERITMRGPADGRITLHVVARNTGPDAAAMEAAGVDDQGVRYEIEVARVEAGQTQDLPIALRAGRAGQRTIELAVRAGQGETAKATLQMSVPDYYRADYGRLIEGTAAGPKAALWWCDATHKIAPQRALPTSTSPAACLSAARNDREAVQVVLRPTEDLEALTATAGALAGPDGATIPAENVKILRVAYHFVDHPTDKTGVRDYWPDALPPLAKPLDLPAGKNQPLWVLVHVPKDAKAGDYTAQLSLKAEGFSASVPLKLHVWDFALPERNHVETAFGFSPDNVFRYHQLQTEAEKRTLLEKYFQCFAEHRISPYDPVPLDGIGVEFLADADPPRAELDFAAFDRAMARAVQQFHFTGYRLPIRGMGGGTFHSRSEPSIGRFTADTPQYRAMFSSYVGQLERHLREKGWLKHAYIYWFDEPAPKDYQFVADGMQRLKKHAPGLRRMLTEEPGDNPLSGTVDIWCPVSFNYDHQKAQQRRARGERFWWYVCTGPKAPYCTLFIDHPATELRVWLWQTWQRDIGGVLVWSSNYWTSGAAFPDRPQNPYEDPMGYVSGYSTPRGTKRYWGNGDGRFIYPPESAALPGASGPGPVLDPPASSIRWEMLREGIEDWEYLYLLRDLLAERRAGLPPAEIRRYEALLEVPESITRDMTTFTTDPAPIYARRAEIAAAIEALAR